MFVKFSCACVGLRLSDGRCFLIHPCDGDGYDHDTTFREREGLGEKEYAPLSPEREERLLRTLNRLVHAGQDMEQVAHLFQRHATTTNNTEE